MAKPDQTMRRDVADHLSQVSLDIPGEIPENESQRFCQLNRASQFDAGKQRIPLGEQAQGEIVRQGQRDIGRCRRRAWEEITLFVDAQLQVEKPAMQADLRTRMRTQLFPGPGFAFEHVIQCRQQGAGQHVQNLKPRCRATTPMAMLKYSTFSSPTPSIIAFNSSWEGCMRIDSER